MDNFDFIDEMIEKPKEKIVSNHLYSQDKVFSVSEISNLLKNLLEGAFHKIKIKGEIQGLKKHSSGTYYFDLKENFNGKDFILNCVLWKYTKVDVKLEDGLEVILTGKITAYTGRSSYQIIVESVEVSGVGALLKIIEQRKQKLLAEGIFDAAHKKSIPYLPKLVGVITSPTGSVIKDILHRISERFPVSVIVYPVAVQGEGADVEITTAINNFNKMVGDKRPDVIIVARGGGSVQDLMPFNEENVVRAVFNSKIPVISGVGHETDTTLIDLVADLRAPTPTGAAEKVVPVRAELKLQLAKMAVSLNTSIFNKLEFLKLKLTSLYNKLKSPMQFVLDAMQRLDDKSAKLDFLIRNKLQREQEKINYFDKMLNSYSFKNVLKRGFSIVWDGQNNIIDSAEKLKKQPAFIIEMFDGKVLFDNNKNADLKQKNIKRTGFLENKQEELF